MDQNYPAQIEKQKIAHFKPIAFEDVLGWESDDHLEAIQALHWSAKRVYKKPYKTKELGVDADKLSKIFAQTNFESFKTKQAAKKFFEDNFTPHLITPIENVKNKNGNDLGSFDGFVTAYFEPEIKASPVKTDRFKFPILKRPHDLVAISDDERPDTMSKEFFFARQTDGEFSTFPNRAAIETGALDGQDLEIYWFESRIDIFFIHIQGSARLILPDNTVARISYDGKSGHAFTPIGRLLIERGEIERQNITMQSIRDWLRSHPEKADDLMRENESFIFFQKIDHPATKEQNWLGPVAAAGVPLSPNRSLAVDHRLQTFGAPIFISTRDPIHKSEYPFQKLMFAQDTGSAIVGAARGDLFIGTGVAAEEIAGGVKHIADFIILLPNDLLAKDSV